MQAEQQKSKIQAAEQLRPAPSAKSSPKVRKYSFPFTASLNNSRQAQV
jgi:hypothetical protein